MYGYAGNSAAATVLKAFLQPPEVANPAGELSQATAVTQAVGAPAASSAQSALADWISSASAALQAFSTPSGLWNFLDSNFVNGFVSAGYTSPAVIHQTVTGAMADINAVGVGSTPGATALPPSGAGPGAETWTPIIASPGPVPYTAAAVQVGSGTVPSGWTGGVSAEVNRAALVGQLSVPSSWTEATQVVNHAGTALPGGGWTGTAVPNGSEGVPGMPGMPAVGPGTAAHFGSGPRYGFRPTIMSRPPAAG